MMPVNTIRIMLKGQKKQEVHLLSNSFFGAVTEKCFSFTAFCFIGLAGQVE